MRKRTYLLVAGVTLFSAAWQFTNPYLFWGALLTSYACASICFALWVGPYLKNSGG